jgi:hypothetical protein
VLPLPPKHHSVWSPGWRRRGREIRFPSGGPNTIYCNPSHLTSQIHVACHSVRQNNPTQRMNGITTDREGCCSLPPSIHPSIHPYIHTMYTQIWFVSQNVPQTTETLRPGAPGDDAGGWPGHTSSTSGAAFAWTQHRRMMFVFKGTYVYIP